MSFAVTTLPTYAKSAQKDQAVGDATGDEQTSSVSNAPRINFTTMQNGVHSIPGAVIEQSTTSQSVHASAPPASNPWIPRDQKQHPTAVSESIPKESPAFTAASSVTSMSRSSSRKSKTRNDFLLDDANAWPEVGETLQRSPARIQKDLPEKPSGASGSYRKDKKWVPIPPAEMQAAIDAARAAAYRQQRATKSQSQTRSHSSASQSLVQSVRSSPHMNGRSRPLPDEIVPASIPYTPSPMNQPPSQRHAPRLSAPQTHPLPERPAASRPRRPAPSKSLPFGGWTSVQDLVNTRHKPLFGSFRERLSVNVTPKIGELHHDFNTSPSGSPPSPSLFGPGGPLERVSKQRGKIAIGLEVPGANSDDRSESQSTTIGQEQDGWFVVGVSGVKGGGGTGGLEFGQFNTSSNAPYNDSSRGGRRQGADSDGYPSARGSRRGSFSESNTGVISQYRHSSQPSSSGGPGSRRGSGRGGNQRNSTYGSRSGGSGAGYGRSISTPNTAPYGQQSYVPQISRGYGSYDPTDRYAQPMLTDGYGGWYYPPTPPGAYQAAAPYIGAYQGYAPPIPTPYISGTPAAGAAPPIPMPITQTPYQLDPLRFWLLGQVEYYFSLQNLSTDLFLRQQMDSEGWIDISVISSFNRVRQLTEDSSLVRDAMSLSAYLELNEDKVRLSQRRWADFVLPASTSQSEIGLNLTAPTTSTRSAAAQSLVASLSGLSFTGDDTATIQAKVTEAVLSTKSSTRHYSNANGSAVPNSSATADESVSSTTAGSLGTDATPAVGTSPPSSPGSETHKLAVVA